jgi:hypothetical protein
MAVQSQAAVGHSLARRNGQDLCWERAVGIGICDECEEREAEHWRILWKIGYVEGLRLSERRLDNQSGSSQEALAAWAPRPLPARFPARSTDIARSTGSPLSTAVPWCVARCRAATALRRSRAPCCLAPPKGSSRGWGVIARASPAVSPSTWVAQRLATTG